jgi:hypothetical protein
MLAPYLVLLAVTIAPRRYDRASPIAYDPFNAWLLSHRVASSGDVTRAVVISLPIIAMVAWVPRLATERRSIRLAIGPVQLTIERTRLDRVRPV